MSCVLQPKVFSNVWHSQAERTDNLVIRFSFAYALGTKWRTISSASPRSSRHGPFSFDNAVLSEVEFYRFRPGDALPYASHDGLTDLASVVQAKNSLANMNRFNHRDCP